MLTVQEIEYYSDPVARKLAIDVNETTAKRLRASRGRKATMQQVGSTATKILQQVDQDGHWTAVRYHWTDVVRWNTNGKIILNHGGYMSATIKTRMNQASNQFGLGFTVWQKNYEWFVDVDGKTIPFETRELVIRNGQ